MNVYSNVRVGAVNVLESLYRVAVCAGFDQRGKLASSA